MAEYLMLLPHREAAWDELTPDQQDAAMQFHAQFWRDLEAGGHRVMTASPLAPTSEAVSMRYLGNGRVSVTDGPFAESAEQILGFYLIETDDYPGLVRCCEALARGDNHIELRRLQRGDGS